MVNYTKKQLRRIGIPRHIKGDLFIIEESKTITSSNEIGDRGSICWDSNYIYICVDDNVWKRVGISTW